ncbi:DUF5389 domain-containing protein [Actinobacillus seminis]|uniref:DUF5389 domain-containing protein n=1 Tax=Actinobacillus seminis TaxID=722 RepID=UPI003B953343
MKKQKMPIGFTRFNWALAIFCLPVLLWPLALLISPNLNKNPHLSEFQITWMSVFLWSYPLWLGIVARICYRIHEKNTMAAKSILAISAVFFYAILVYVATVGFN